jgi:hypothetical protein
MNTRRVRLVVLFLLACASLGRTAEAQRLIDGQSIIDHLNPFHSLDPAHPVTVSGLCKRLDCVAEELRDDGLIVVKQPDVFSQARLTRFRTEFDNQMSTDLANFHLVLAARINRLDAATTTQTTALSASLAAPGTTTLSAPDATKFIGAVSGANSPFATGGTSLFGQQIDPTKGTFGNLGLAANNYLPIPASVAASTALGLGVDPTVYLDEKKRFLDHLNEIRRISLRPDQNDSSGYGLYLVRMPISITPGECTYQGYGAELSVAVEHEFTDQFLPSTFQNLVENDLVDQLGPFLYEIIRSGFDDELESKHDAKQKGQALALRSEILTNSLLDKFVQRIVNAANTGAVAVSPPGNHGGRPDSKSSDQQAVPLRAFILNPLEGLIGDPDNDRKNYELLAQRLSVLADARGKIKRGDRTRQAERAGEIAKFRMTVETIRRGETAFAILPELVLEFLRDVLSKENYVDNDPNMELLRPFIQGLYKTALANDVKQLDDVLQVLPADRLTITKALAQNNESLRKAWNYGKYNVNLPSSRTAKQLYPISPRQLLFFFGEDNIYLLAKEVQEASRTENVRLVDVRNYLRHTLQPAYFAMTNKTARQLRSPLPPPLDDDEFLGELYQAIQQRETRAPNQGTLSRLEQLNKDLIDRLSEGRDNIKNRPIGALCWAIAVDAVLLDYALNQDARRVLAAQGAPCDLLDTVHFYYSKNMPNEAGKAVFSDYVRYRWPIITFSLDPATDQQNIADSFNLRRDLQLALSFAFATGQIGFNQLNTFRRQIEQSSDTIALNRTVTAFAHGNDSFAFRFTPRFQNPPNQRTNIGVIASQLIGGGPGPDYQVKKSKLEPGLRELTAILLIPTFLPSMRMNVSSNWFKLNDPEHLVYHTSRQMEQGRKVQQTRQAVVDLCSAQKYRGADLRVLQAKLGQLEAMLPMQSTVVQLPFDNAASGFDLFSEGATALAPELTGYSGVDVIKAPAATATSAAAAPVAAATPAASTTPAPPTPGVTLTTTTNASGTTTTTSITGAGSIADVFVFGKYINLLDTRVIAGGRSAAFEILSREVIHVQIPGNVIPTTTDDGDSYIEVFVSTPNGISNSLLIPYQASPPTPKTKVDYDLDANSQSIDVYYQWLPDASGKAKLVATYDPGTNKNLGITWDSGTGLAPKRLRAQFSATVNGQNIAFYMAANGSSKGDYSMDLRRFIVGLLQRLQDVLTAPTAAPAQIKLTVNVQPWIPSDAENLRVRTEAKALKSTLTVNMQYNATGMNALLGVAPPDLNTGALLSPRPRPDLGDQIDSIAATRPVSDLGVVRTAQGPASLPPFSNLPQAPQVLDTRALLPPNVASEAEQVGRLLTGQPVNAQIGSIPPVALPAPQAVSTAGTANTTATVTTTTTSTSAPQGQPIVVLPAPVVVIPPKPEEKKHARSRLHNSRFFKNLGNRISQAMPSMPSQ